MSHEYEISSQTHLDSDNEEEAKIYIVADGLKSKATKDTYNQAYNDFIKTNGKT